MKKRDGWTGIFVELPNELVAELDEFVSRYPLGGKADHIRLALRRHMDTPPTVAVPALPPVEASPPPKKGRAKKG